MNETNLPIELALKRVVTAVKSASNGKQEPWMEGSIEGDFCFGACGGLSAPTTAAAPAQDAELVFWGSIQSSTNSEDFKAYLEQYPGGRFAGLARNRLKTNTAPPPVQVAVAPPSTVATQPAPLQQGLQNIAAGSVFKDCNDCPEMVAIPAGSYAMGGSRQITISRQFAVGKTEVTFAQWDACVAEGGCTHRPDDRGWGRGSMPVMSVNWDDAKQFVGWLTRKSGKSYRLLTEAEWEYAARAGTTTEYYWGDRDSDICRYASVDKGGNGCGTNQTSLVASKQPNAFGLYDMLGNVWEWVEDCYNDGVSGVPSNGAARTSGDCGLRVLRGGSWGTEPQNARAAYRNWNDTASRYISFNGFRVARTF